MRRGLNKKGDLKEEIPEILLFLIASVILIVAIWNGIGILKNQELEKAEDFIDGVKKKIDGLDDEKKGELITKGITGWYLAGWSVGNPARPERCALESCICICKGKKKNAKKDCQENGLCRDVNKEKVTVAKFTELKGAKLKISVDELLKLDDKLSYFKLTTDLVEGRDYFLYRPLLSCPWVSEKNLIKLMIYKGENQLSLFVIGERDIDSEKYKPDFGCQG
jgi:hypothetical protein